MHVSIAPTSPFSLCFVWHHLWTFASALTSSSLAELSGASPVNTLPFSSEGEARHRLTGFPDASSFLGPSPKTRWYPWTDDSAHRWQVATSRSGSHRTYSRVSRKHVVADPRSSGSRLRQSSVLQDKLLQVPRATYESTFHRDRNHLSTRTVHA